MLESGNPAGKLLEIINNAITDGGVALPKFLLTIVMKLSNFKSLRISRNSKDSKKAKIGSWRVRSRPLRIRPSRSRPSRLRRSGRLPLNATDCSRLPQTATDCQKLPHTAADCHILQPTATYCNRLTHTAIFINLPEFASIYP